MSVTTTDTVSSRSTQIGSADKELIKKSYSRIAEGFIFLGLSFLIAIPIVGLLSPERMIESGRTYILAIPLFIMIYGFERLGKGVLKLKKPSYLLGVILMALGFVPYIIITIALPYSLHQIVYTGGEIVYIIEEEILSALVILSRVGILGMILLLIFMWRDLVTPHKEYTLVALVIAVIGLIVFPDIMMFIASLIMAYNLYSLRKKLALQTVLVKRA